VETQIASAPQDVSQLLFWIMSAVAIPAISGLVLWVRKLYDRIGDLQDARLNDMRQQLQQYHQQQQRQEQLILCFSNICAVNKRSTWQRFKN
jgi:hypothetical protein